jgi:putative DNA primase/helicase
MNATDIDKINAQAARLKDAAAGVPALVAAKPNGATPPDGAHAAHLVDPEPPRATEPGATAPGTEAKADPLGNDEAEHDAPPSAAEAEQSSEYKAQGPEAAEGEQPPSDAKPEPSLSDERHDDDDLSKLGKGAKKALRRAIASMKLGKSEPLKILQAVRAGVVALMKFDLEPGFNAAIAHLRDVARDLYELPVKDIQPQIDGGIQDVLEERAAGAKPSAGKSERKGSADRDVADDQQPPLSEADSDAEIRRLASLSVLQYARQRDDAAKRLGVGLGMIDRLVKAERDKTAGAGTQGRPLSFPQIEPWPDPVDGAALLDDLVVAISRHIVMLDYAVHATAVWVVHTYLLDVTDITPRLGIMSPEKGCGKSTLLKLLKSLVYRPLLATNVSAPGVFRVVEMMRPTFLIDEADTFLPDNEPLRGILNAGHERGSEIVRPVGEDHVPHLFSTYAACAVAQIGRLPDTIADRSIRIELRRRKPGDRIVELRHGRTGHLDELARRVARWASDNAERVHAIDPAVPPGVFNRAADNWRPLLAIADAAGGDWPECARLACTAAVAGAEDESVKALLLADIRVIFAEKGADHLSSADLVEALVALEGHPWAEWKGKAITQNGLARLLKPFGISPVKRTYELFQFDDAFERYLPQDPNSQVSKCP